MLDREEAKRTAEYHARRRGETYVVWSCSTICGNRYHWIAPLAHPLGSWKALDVRPEYITL